MIKIRTTEGSLAMVCDRADGPVKDEGKPASRIVLFVKGDRPMDGLLRTPILRPRAFPVNTGSTEMLYLFVFAALSDAEAIPLRLEML